MKWTNGRLKYTIVSDEPAGDPAKYYLWTDKYLVAENVPPQFSSLICAAPELLEQIKKLLEFAKWAMEDCGIAPGDEDEYLIVDCERVIEKAEGK